MDVPLLDLKAQYATIKAEIQEAVEAVLAENDLSPTPQRKES